MSDSLIYELIRVAIGTSDSLSRAPSKKEWYQIYSQSEKQALLAICFYGIQKLYKHNAELVSDLPLELRIKWIGMSVSVQNRNIQLNNQCVIIQKQFKEAGLNTCILKGQGVASYYYPELSCLRQSGDIDIWVDAGWKKVMDYVCSRTPNREFDIKHAHINAFDDTIVEVHWWPSVAINLCYQRTLQDYYRKQAPHQCQHRIALQNEQVITAPDAIFEAVHILYHIYNHFLYEGIGLRQIMDLYFVLVNGGLTEQDRLNIEKTYRRLGLAKIAPAVMWVLCEVFNMDEEFCIGKKDNALGHILLRDIEDGGNFGVHSEENRINHESFIQRMIRRMKRRIRLVKFNPLGVISSPFTKVMILLWKRKVIKMYNL